MTQATYLIGRGVLTSPPRIFLLLQRSEARGSGSRATHCHMLAYASVPLATSRHDLALPVPRRIRRVPQRMSKHPRPSSLD